MELKRVINFHHVLLLLAVVSVNLIIFGYKLAPAVRDMQITERTAENVRTPEEIRLIKQQKYIDGYQESIQRILDRAELLKSNPLFADEDSFSYNNIIRTAKDYAPLLDVKLTLDNHTAIQEISEYPYTYIFSFLVIVFMLDALYAERDNGMWQITYTASKGRLQLALKRIGIVVLVSFAVCGLLYWSAVLLALVSLDGFDGIMAPVQNLTKFGKCTLLVNMLEYLILNFVWSFLSVLALACVILMLMTVFRNRKNVLVGVTAFCIIEYLLYRNIESSSIYRVFQYINIVNLFKMSDLCMTYNNIGFSTVVMGLGRVVPAVLGGITVLSAIVSAAVYTRMKPFVKETLFTKLIQKINAGYQRILTEAPHMFKEMHKNILTAKGVWAMLGALFAAGYFSTTGMVVFSDIQNVNDKMYLTHGGADYSYIVDYINEFNAELQAYEHEKEEAQIQYKNGEITFEVYYAALTSYEIMVQSMSGIQEPMEKLEYLKHLEAERGIHGYMMSDRGYAQIFGKDSVQRACLIGVALFVAVVLISFGSVKLEKYSGVSSIVNAGYKGAKLHHCSKMASCIVVSVLLCAAVCMIDYYNLSQYYGAPYLEAPVQSITFMKDIVLRVSVRQWMFLVIAVKCILSAVVSAAAYAVSAALLGNRR